MTNFDLRSDIPHLKNLITFDLRTDKISIEELINLTLDPGKPHFKPR